MKPKIAITYATPMAISSECRDYINSDRFICFQNTVKDNLSGFIRYDPVVSITDPFIPVELKNFEHVFLMSPEKMTELQYYGRDTDGHLWKSLIDSHFEAYVWYGEKGYGNKIKILSAAS